MKLKCFHYGFVDKLDTYVGIFLGYDIVSAKQNGTALYQPGGFTSNASGVVFSSYIGGRYFFSDKFAGMLELGYGISWLNVGVAVKL